MNEKRRVYTLTTATGEWTHYHIQQRNESYGKQIATAYGWDFQGEYDGKKGEREARYLLPHQTLVLRPEEAQALGIKSERDFYGGQVAEPFQATKAIMHPLVHGDAQRP